MPNTGQIDTALGLRDGLGGLGHPEIDGDYSGLN